MDPDSDYEHKEHMAKNTLRKNIYKTNFIGERI